jgi:Leucine rich repeat
MQINNCSNIFIAFDIKTEFIPIVSTFSNLTNIFQKIYIIPCLRKTAINNNHYYTYLKNKSFMRCCTLLFPIIGNLAVFIKDEMEVAYYQMNADHYQLIVVLDNWKKDLTVTGDKEKACQLIQEAFITKQDTLNLSKLGLNKLPSIIGQLTQLTALDLSDNKLKAIPEELCRLTKLIILNLCYNKLKNIPKELGQLTQLTTFDLSHNKLEAIPKEIGWLFQLTTLNFCDNKLKNIPKELGQLTQLTTFDISHNSLQTIPREIDQLSPRTTLYLSHNCLQAIPKRTGQLSHYNFLQDFLRK